MSTKVRYKKVLLYPILLCFIFLLPFNALPIYFLGQGGSEGAIYPAIVLMIIVWIIVFLNFFIKKIFKTYKIEVLYIITLLYLVVFISFYLNIENILQATHMHKTGIGRLVGQLLQLTVGFSVVYALAYIINSKKRFFFILRYINIFMIIFILFAGFQYLAYEFQNIFLIVYRFLGNYLYHDSVIPFALERRHALHSFTQEPSFLGMYIGVIGPFVVAYGFYTKKYFVSLFMLLIVLMSLSRAAYGIVLVELLLFIYFYKYKYLKIGHLFTYSIISLVFIVLLMLLSPVGDILMSLFDLENNGSNAARYAATYSAIQVWLNNNLLFGVGLGQTGFYSIDYLPDWGFLSNDVWDTINDKRWPPIHNLLVRILVELGIVGLFLWLLMFGFILFYVHKIIFLKYKIYTQYDYFGYATFISVIGALLTMFTRELFTNMLIWTSLGMALAYINLNKGIIFEKKKSC